MSSVSGSSGLEMQQLTAWLSNKFKPWAEQSILTEGVRDKVTYETVQYALQSLTSCQTAMDNILRNEANKAPQYTTFICSAAVLENKLKALLQEKKILRELEQHTQKTLPKVETQQIKPTQLAKQSVVQEEPVKVQEQVVAAAEASIDELDQAIDQLTLSSSSRSLLKTQSTYPEVSKERRKLQLERFMKSESRPDKIAKYAAELKKLEESSQQESNQQQSTDLKNMKRLSRQMLRRTLSIMPEETLLLSFEQHFSTGTPKEVLKHFGELPIELVNKIKLGIWILSAMPKGDPDYGGTVMHQSPTGDVVKQVVKAYTENEGCLFNTGDSQLLKTLSDSLQSNQLPPISSQFTKLSMPVQKLIKDALCKQNDQPLEKGDGLFTSLLQKSPVDESLKFVMKHLHDASPARNKPNPPISKEPSIKDLLASFPNLFQSNNHPAILEAFYRLSPDLLSNIQLGIWIFSGMPKGSDHFGEDLMKKNPCDPVVQKVIQAYIDNNGHLLNRADCGALKHLGESLNSQDKGTILTAFHNMSYTNQELVKFGVWVAKGQPWGDPNYAGNQIQGFVDKDGDIHSVIHTLIRLATL